MLLSTYTLSLFTAAASAASTVDAAPAPTITSGYHTGNTTLTPEESSFQSSILVQSSTASGQPTSSVSTLSLPASVVDSFAPEPTISSSFEVCAPVATTTVVQKEVVTVTVSASSAALPVKTEASVSFEETPVSPTAASTGFGEAPYPIPSGTGRRPQHKPYPTGVFPSGWPFPSGGFGGRPVGSFPEPSGFLTQTKPVTEAAASTPAVLTPAALSSAAPAVPIYGSY